MLLFCLTVYSILLAKSHHQSKIIYMLKQIYLHGNSISPNSWKVGTLKTLLLRAFVVCSNEQLLNKEIEHLRNVVRHTSGYPKALIQNVISKVKEEQSAQSVKITESH